MTVLKAWLAGVILSMLPFSELRGGIPVAISGGVHPAIALLSSFIANSLIVIPIWLFLDHIHVYILRVKIYERFSEKVLVRVRERAAHIKKSMEFYEWFALTLFVAIPLPVTGAYTAALVAWVLGLNRKKSFFFISLGVLIAASIVTFVTLGFINLFSYLVG